MIGLTYEQIVTKISEEKQISKEDIEIKIKAKLSQLSDLISKEGAAHIIANELGVKLFQAQPQGKVKIEELNPMMRSIDILAKVIKIYEVRSFERNGSTSKVASLLVGDETGVSRFVFWDMPLVEKIEKQEIKENDILLGKNAYVRENNGYKEVHFGSNSAININPPGETVEVKPLEQSTPDKKQIKDLQAGEFVTIVGTVVQIFEPRFYSACPQCNKKVMEDNGVFRCEAHGVVTPNPVPIVNFYFDDGSDSLRVVAFREQAEQVMDLKIPELQALSNNPEKFREVQMNIAGKQLEISGRVQKNEMFQRIEVIASSVAKADPKKLIEEVEKV